MKPEVHAFEMGAVTWLSLQFKNGPFAAAHFFPEPENQEEITQQLPYIVLQKLCAECEDCKYGCEKCTWGRWFAAASILAGALSAILSTWLFLAGMIAVLPYFVLYWQTGREDRAKQKAQITFIQPIQKVLNEFADQNDFRGALNYLSEVQNAY